MKSIDQRHRYATGTHRHSKTPEVHDDCAISLISTDSIAMFTWIPIHQETAKRLLDFKDCNHELVNVISLMKRAGPLTTKIVDQGTND